MNETRRNLPEDGIEAAERDLADRLHLERPHPSPAFRGNLRRRLSISTGEEVTRRLSPIPLIAGYPTGGALLLLVAAAGVAGFGPFAS
jgi:hypothetical protein